MRLNVNAGSHFCAIFEQKYLIFLLRYYAGNMMSYPSVGDAYAAIMAH